jgi:hypothetical protein
MMPMVDGFATRNKRRTVANIAKSFSIGKEQEKLKRTFIGDKSCIKALFNKKNSGTSTGINSIIKIYYYELQ